MTTKVIEKWYKIIKCIKATRKLSFQEMSKYKTNIEDLRCAIIDLINNKPPISREDNPLKFPMIEKTYIIFGKDSERWLDDWGIFGGVDKENTETVHTVFNQLKRRFCGMSRRS